MAEQLDAEELWRRMQELLQRGDLNPPLWAAVDAVRPLTVDDDTMVVAVQTAEMQHAGYIESGRNKAQLQQLLEQVSGQHLNIRVIDGATVADWERVKQRETAGAAAASAQAQARAAQKGAQAIWRQGAEEVFAIFTGARARARGTDLARLMLESVAAMCEVEQAAREDSPDDEELHSQQLNRVIDRVATYCSVPPPVVALEYVRYCRDQD